MAATSEIPVGFEPEAAIPEGFEQETAVPEGFEPERDLSQYPSLRPVLGSRGTPAASVEPYAAAAYRRQFPQVQDVLSPEEMQSARERDVTPLVRMPEGLIAAAQFGPLAIPAIRERLPGPVADVMRDYSSRTAEALSGLTTPESVIENYKLAPSFMNPVTGAATAAYLGNKQLVQAIEEAPESTVGKTAADAIMAASMFLPLAHAALPRSIEALTKKEVSPNALQVRPGAEVLRDVPQISGEGAGEVPSAQSPGGVSQRDLPQKAEGGAEVPLTPPSPGSVPIPEGFEVEAKSPPGPITYQPAIKSPEGSFVVGGAHGELPEVPGGTRGYMSSDGRFLTLTEVAREQMEQSPMIGMGGATAGEFSPVPVGPTAMKFRKIDLERQERGLEPLAKPASISDQETLNKALSAFDENPDVADQLIAELNERPRVISDVENHILNLRKIELRDLYEKAANEAVRAFEDAKEFPDRQQDAELATLRAQFLSDKLNDLETASRVSGSERGRALRSLQVMLNEDFSLASLERQKRAANGGRPITAEERSHLSEIADRYKRESERLRTVETGQAATDRAQAVESAVKSTENEASSQTPGNRDLIAEKAQISEFLKDHFLENGRLENTNRAIRKLMEILWQQGVRDRVGMELAVRDIVNRAIPPEAAMTLEEVQDLMSGYGKYKLLSQEAAKAGVRDIVGQVQQVRKLLDFFKGRAPSKTGVERRIPSDIERALIKVVNNAKKAFGTISVDPATALRSALESINTRLKNRITDLKQEIATRKKIVRERAPSPYNEETIALRKELEDVKSQHAEIFGKPELTEAQRVARAESALDRQIEELERQLKSGEVFPKTKTGTAPTSEAITSKKAQLEALKEERYWVRDLIQPKMEPEAARLQSLLARLRGREADYLERINNKDFSPRSTRRPEPVEESYVDAKAAVEKVKRQWEIEKRNDELGRRKTWQKIAAKFVGVERAIKLSNYLVFGKLAAAALTRVATTAAEETAGSVISRVVPTVSKQAPRGGGGISISLFVKALGEAITKGMSDAAETLKEGTSKLEQIYGERQIDKDWVNFLGRAHGMIKAPVKRFELTIALEKRFDHAIRNRLDVTDKTVKARLIAESIDDSLRSIFLQRGFSADMFNQIVTQMERSKKYPVQGEVAARAARFLFPIVRVPINIVGETFTGVHGLPTASARYMYHAIRGSLDRLDPKVADSMMRQFTKGSIGLGLMAIGYFFPGQVGGYDWREKRSPGTAKTGGFRLFDTDVPRWVTHAPWFELMQMGATMRHVKEEHVKGEEKGISEGAWAAGLGLLSETPFVGEMFDLSKIQEPKGRTAYLGELAKGTVVPQVVSQIAKSSDPEERRKASTILEYIQSGIPGLREQLPPGKPR